MVPSGGRRGYSRWLVVSRCVLALSTLVRPTPSDLLQRSLWNCRFRAQFLRVPLTRVGNGCAASEGGRVNKLDLVKQ